jgi:hypothetical protein
VIGGAAKAYEQEAGAAIEAALLEVAGRLEAGDAVASAEAVARLVAACEAAEGKRLDAPTLARLAPVLERCQAMASETHGELRAALLRFGQQARAIRAYRG